MQSVAKRFVHMLTSPAFSRTMYARGVADMRDALLMGKEVPADVCSKLLSEHLYRGAPWSITTDDKVAELDQMSLHDIVAFHKTYVQPSKMFAVIVGDFDVKTLRNDMENAFGNWRNKRGAEGLDVSIDKLFENPAPCTLSSFLPQEQLVVMGGRLTVPNQHDDAPALALLSGVLSKKLFEIRERTGLFYSIASNLDASERSIPSMASIYFLVTPEKSLIAVEEVKAVFRELMQHGISKELLTVEKQKINSNLSKALVSNDAIASMYHLVIASGETWDDYTQYLERLERVTCEDVRRVAKRYLDPQGWSFVHVGRVSQ